MSLNTKIEWARHTVNFWWGCEEVSPACAFCYAREWAKYASKGKATWGADGERWIRAAALDEARKIDRLALGERATETGYTRVFVNSMSDTFEDHPALGEARAAALELMGSLVNVQWLLLTKRPENVQRMVPEAWRTAWPAQVWIGTTVEDQARADLRIPELLCIPAKVRFLSCEPLLECVRLDKCQDDELGATWNTLEMSIHWVICGGESGAHARAMNPAWARSLRDQCVAAGVPFFFKQWGEYGADGERIGKKAAGRLLDWREWSEVPVIGDAPMRADASDAGLLL